jgi:hypothetical protein
MFSDIICCFYFLFFPFSVEKKEFSVDFLSFSFNAHAYKEEQKKKEKERKQNNLVR